MSSHDRSDVEPASATHLDISAPRDYDGALILRSKFHPPPARRGTVVRRELLGRLDEDVREAAVKLILVVAPAGWGKTSLLEQWWSRGARTPSAWLSIDRGDNDPARFWAHLVAAMKEASGRAEADATRSHTVPDVKIADILLPEVINDFVQASEQMTVIADNYDLISNPAIHECVEFFIENLPPTLRLVLIARSEPALPLARLRTRGEMREIRADELRFSDAETVELLNGAMNLHLPPDHVRILGQRTEGWAAGLYLAGLSLRGHEDPVRGVHAFAGDNRQVADYLVAEVLDAQPAHIRSFLTRTAVLDRMCGGLCDAVTGAGGSQRILEDLERSSLFIAPLDTSRTWYRYHSLFADMLRRELERSEPGLGPLLHERASQWHRQHGSAAEAVCHAIMASDLSCAREVIAAPWHGRFAQGLTETVESWLTSLSPEVASEDSRLRLMKAWLASHLGSLDEVEPWVGIAEAATLHGTFVEGPSSIESAACIVRAGSSHMLGDLADAESASRRAVELEEAGSRRWRLVALASLGASLHWLGEDGEAVEILREVADPAARPADNLAALWAIGCLSAIALRTGDIDSCERRLDEAASLVARHGLGEYRESATALLALADLRQGRGELREAEEAALGGLNIARRGQARLEAALALLSLAKIKARAGLTGEAQASLSSAKDVLRRCASPGILVEIAAAAECAVSPQSQPAAAHEHRRHRPDGLTSREVEVFELLAAGKTNNEIAADLVVSVHTVERHLQNAYRKIGARNRGQAAAYIARAARLAETGQSSAAGRQCGRSQRWRWCYLSVT